MLGEAKVKIVSDVRFLISLHRYMADVTVIIDAQVNKDGDNEFPKILLNPDVKIFGDSLEPRAHCQKDSEHCFAECAYFKDYENAVEFCKEKLEEVKSILKEVAEANKEKSSKRWKNVEELTYR